MLSKLTSRLSPLFHRSPATGDRKDRIMPDPTPQQNAPAPTPQTPQHGAPDVTAHLAALADAMRQLAESQKSLAELVKPSAPQPLAASQSAPRPPTPDITGDPVGGASPAALNAIDYSKLSPLQQITLGLRDAARPAPRAGAD